MASPSFKLALSCLVTLAVVAVAVVANGAGGSFPTSALTSSSLVLRQSGGDAPLFQARDVTPGWRQSACIAIEAHGGAAERLALFGQAAGALAPALRLTVLRGDGPDPGAGRSCAGFAAQTLLYDGSLAGWTQERGALVNGPGIGDGGRAQYQFTLALSTGAGSAYESQAATANIDFGAEPPAAAARVECADGIDNDGDGRTDHPADSGCRSASDSSERDDARQIDELVLCGRRPLSLISAQLTGRRVVLRGVVARRYRGRKVTLFAFGRRVARVRPAAATGLFVAKVKAPRGRSLRRKVRYTARIGGMRSKALKLPRSVKASSIRLRASTSSTRSTIVLRGRVLQPRARKPRPVVVQRLMCGKYTRMGVARPDRKGRFAVSFAAPDAAAGLFRTETKVPVRKGAKRVKRAYGHAVAVRLDDRSG